MCTGMIDPATSWFEIYQYCGKQAITVANITEEERFSRCPWPTRVTFDRSSKFIGHEFKKMLNDYGVKKKPITTRNPQASAIVKQVHQTIGNIIQTFELHDNYLYEDDPWKGILAATAFAICATGLWARHDIQYPTYCVLGVHPCT
jgi:hypothetical protein